MPSASTTACGSATATQAGTVWLWGVPDGVPLGVIPVSRQPLRSVQFDPANPLWILTSGDDGYARVFNINTSTEVGYADAEDASLEDAAFSPNGKLIAVAGNEGDAQIYFVGKQERKPVAFKQFGAAFNKDGSKVTSVAFDPSGTRVMTTDTGGYAEWFYATSPSHANIDQLEEPDYNSLTTGAFSPSGGFILTGGDDGTARIWNLDSDQPFVSLAGHEGPINALAINKAGRILITASVDGTARIWSTEPIDERKLLLDQTDDVCSVAFSPTNLHLLAAGADNGTVSLWNTSTGSQLARWSTGSDYCASAQFSHNGQFLVTTDGTQQARIWGSCAPGQACRHAGPRQLPGVYESCRFQQPRDQSRDIQPERKIRRDRRRGRQRMRLDGNERNDLPPDLEAYQ